MLRTRVIPALLLRDESLVKTTRFDKYCYVGDPCNTVRIFNELEIDELFFLDITATPAGREPNLELLADIADECFMPLGYGGGVRSAEQARKILAIGFEKVLVNTAAVENPAVIASLADDLGGQAVVVGIDVRRNLWGRHSVRTRSGRLDTALDPVQWAQEVERLGAGEILLTSIDQEGSWEGFDIDLVRAVSDAVAIPVIAHGGAGSLQHIGAAIEHGHASAVALGSMIVFQKRGMGVLVNYPDKALLHSALTGS